MEDVEEVAVRAPKKEAKATEKNRNKGGGSRQPLKTIAETERNEPNELTHLDTVASGGTVNQKHV